jgi:hypothetical protein
MSLEFLIPFIIGYLILWIGFYTFQKINFKNKYSEGFLYRNTFPFETHNFIYAPNLVLRIGFILLSIVGILPFIVYVSTTKITYTLHVDLIISGCFLLVSIFLKILLYFTKTLNIKVYVSEYVFRMLTLIGSMLFLIIGLGASISENLTLYREKGMILWVFLALFVILMFVNLSCLFRSKFFNWYQYEKDENEQIKKPNTIVFALYQWIFDFSEIILVILTTILMYFC